MQDYEKERKARELIEEVCDELAKEIGEDKAEIEALKRESMPTLYTSLCNVRSSCISFQPLM
jgi:hypothetical protein